jgi:hypothetical protein
MSSISEDERRIKLSRDELLTIGLGWDIHYRLLDEGPLWVLDYMRPITPAQYHRAEKLLAVILNRKC